MTKAIHFRCQIECSSLCCGGATIITLSEIGKLYRFFPITIGFQKVYPFDSLHESYLKDITFKYKNYYILGDFIGGNRFSKKCRHLKHSPCSIHGKVKPLQCKIIPFSVTFPESYQDKVIREKRKGAFRNCKGFNENLPIIWNGHFLEKELSNNFYQLKDALMAQKELMENIFIELTESTSLSKFLLSKDGLIEIPLPEKLIKELFLKGLIEEQEDFIKAQKKMFISDLMTDNFKNSLFSEALKVIEKIRI